MSKSLDQADRFTRDPKSFYKRGAEGLPRISFAVMQLAVNGTETGLKAIKPIFVDANADERAAIGKGLYMGFDACQRTSFSDAATILKAVKSMGNADIEAAFLRAKLKAEDEDASLSAASSTAANSNLHRDLKALMPSFEEDGRLDIADPATLPGN